MKYWRWYIRVLILLLMTASILYACFIERHNVELTTHRLQLPEWEGKSARFVVLSDLHARPDEEKYLRRVVELTMEQKPDAVFLLGDYVNGAKDTMALETMEKILEPLSRVPCFAVWGNHDYSRGRRHLRSMFRRLGISMMESRVNEINVGGGRLHIAGARCAFTFMHPGNIPQPRPDVPYILLSHSPAIARHAPEGVELILTGHTHGGQVCVPFYGALTLPDKSVTRRQCAGHQVLHGRNMYISRGVGTSQLPLRFFCRPEILVLELVGREIVASEPAAGNGA